MKITFVSIKSLLIPFIIIILYLLSIGCQQADMSSFGEGAKIDIINEMNYTIDFHAGDVSTEKDTANSIRIAENSTYRGYTIVAGKDYNFWFTYIDSAQNIKWIVTLMNEHMTEAEVFYLEADHHYELTLRAEEYYTFIDITQPEEIDKVATAQFFPAAGTYPSPIAVTITCETTGADIYYTTDGSTPTLYSTFYTDLITVAEDTTIKAIAVKNSMLDSEVATAQYIIDASSVDGPAITALSPTLNESDVELNTLITATFSVAMDSSTITTSTFIVNDGVNDISGTVTYNDNNNTATFTPTTSLTSGTIYTVTITSSVQDTLGNSLESNYTWTFTTGSSIVTGIISDMVYGSESNIVYALDQDNKSLYFINTTTRTIDETFILTDAQPLAMSYSEIDNNLYIVSKFSGNITVFDLDSNTFSQISFSDTADGHDIEVAPTLRRIYILSPGEYSYDYDLFIMGLDSSEVLLSTAIEGASVVIDESNQLLFTADKSLSPSKIYKYSVAADAIELLSNVSGGSNGRTIGISPDKAHIIFPCGGGNGSVGYVLYDFDALNLDNVFGEWDIGTYPLYAKFSPDGTLLYGANGDSYDEYLYIMDAENYNNIRKLDFPNSDNYCVLSPNRDGTLVVGFSYDSYNETEYYLYFFSNVEKNLLRQRKRFPKMVE